MINFIFFIQKHKNIIITISVLIITFAVAVGSYFFWDSRAGREREDVEVPEEIEEIDEDYDPFSGVDYLDNEEEEEIGELPVDNVDSVDETVSLQEVETLAKNWIKAHSATYRERSDRGEIKLIDKNTRGEGEYEIIFQFTTHDDGFGPPEEGEEVETGAIERVAKAIMYYDYVSMLIIDNQWCDLDHREVTQEEIDNWSRPRTEEETL